MNTTLRTSPRERVDQKADTADRSASFEEQPRLPEWPRTAPEQEPAPTIAEFTQSLRVARRAFVNFEAGSWGKMPVGDSEATYANSLSALRKLFDASSPPVRKDFMDFLKGALEKVCRVQEEGVGAGCDETKQIARAAKKFYFRVIDAMEGN